MSRFQEIKEELIQTAIKLCSECDGKGYIDSVINIDTCWKCNGTQLEPNKND